MANIKYIDRRVSLIAAGTRTKGAVVADKRGTGVTLAGVAGQAGAAAANYWVHIRGVFNLAVGTGVLGGAKVYVPGTPPTAGDAITLTTTATSNTLFGTTVTDADASGNADVMLIPPTY